MWRDVSCGWWWEGGIGGEEWWNNDEEWILGLPWVSECSCQLWKDVVQFSLNFAYFVFLIEFLDQLKTDIYITCKLFPFWNFQWLYNIVRPTNAVYQIFIQNIFLILCLWFFRRSLHPISNRAAGVAVVVAKAVEEIIITIATVTLTTRDG